MAISEKKMQIVMNNYFKDECTVNTSIREAFEKGFRIGVQKGYETTKPAEITLESVIDYLQSIGWLQEHDRILTESAEPERMKGKWVVTSEFKDCRYVKCNQCKVTQVFYYNKLLTNFCPNCGADMRSDDE